MFTPTAFYMSVCVGSFLLIWMYPVLMGLMSFYFLGLLEHSFYDCLEYIFILYLLAMCGCYTGIAFGAIFDTHDDGFRIMQILIIAFFMSAGVFVNTKKEHIEQGN